MTVRLKSLSARGEGRIAVLFEIGDGEHVQRETFLLSAVRVADLSLQVGECTAECYEAVEHSAALERAVHRGLSLLGYGAASPKALCRKLVGKGIDRELAAEAVDEICQTGYLNEDAQALREAERCASKLWGEKRIVAALYEKGYSRESVSKAMYGLEDEGTDFVSLCAERIRSHMSPPPRDPVARKKWTATLCRYGFSMTEIRDALKIAEE